MSCTIRRSSGRLLALCLCAFAGAGAHGEMSGWRDAQGNEFRGEPTGILGPFAVFRTGWDQGRRVLLRTLSREDCLRLHDELSLRPPRAASLAAATAEATAELPGNVLQVRNGKLEPVDPTTRPEPELLMVLAGSHNNGEGWFLAGNLNKFYQRVQRIHPGVVEGVFLGVRHDGHQHRNIAVGTGMPWLVADLDSQPSLTQISRYLPKQGANAVLLTRQGVPLLGSQAGEAAGAQAFVDQMSALLWQIDPANPAGWPDRRHYLNAIRPVEFAHTSTGPLLIGDPLRPEVLRHYGVKRVTARLAVAPDGKVTPALVPEECDIPAELAAPLTEVLATAVAAPAIERGRPVPGTLPYRLEVPPADPLRDTEQSWLRSSAYPAVSIGEWLVLRPIPVPEKEFESKVVGQTADGTVILNPLEVNSGRISRAAQMSAFHSDWFAEAGPQSVRPKAGDRQTIGTTVLRWEPVRSRHGFVEMQTGVPRDYVVGYAWAEFESARETEAWLGLGSDDGVRIWLNGELVHHQWVRRPSQIDDEIIPLRLKAGPNRLLIKIQNATDRWNFTYRLRLKP